MSESNIRLMRNADVLNHLIQNNQSSPVSTAVGVFEQRIYDYLLQGLAAISPSALEQLEASLPDTFSEAERLQIMNCPPQTLPQLYSCVYNAQDRFSLQHMEQILETIQKICGFEPDE